MNDYNTILVDKNCKKKNKTTYYEQHLIKFELKHATFNRYSIDV